MTIPYTQKIEELLTKVSKGETVFPKEKPVEKNPLHEKIEKDGVKKVIEHIFNESEEMPRYITETEDELDIDKSSFIYVNVPSSFKDVDEYWNKLAPHFLRLGIPKNDGSKGIVDTAVLKSDGNEEVLRIRAVRDQNNGDKPSIAFLYLNGPELQPIELSTFMYKLGLKLDRAESKKVGNTIIADIIPE
jgi:hypothetical protein